MTNVTAVTRLNGSRGGSAASLARAMERDLGITLDDHQWWSFNFGGWDVITAVVCITPSMADRWLNEHNSVNAGKKNRTLSPTKANEARAKMSGNRWKVSPQSIIAFDQDGDLLDGQHRLTAIRSTDNARFTFRVEYGWPRDSFDVIDSPYTRRAFHLADCDHPQQVVSAARIVASVSGMAPRENVCDGITARGDTALILEWKKQWPELEQYVGRIMTVKRACSLNAPIHLAIIAQALRTRHAHMIPAWLDALETGAGLASGDPRLLLRNKWIAESRTLGGSGSYRTAPYVMTVKAWNAYVVGKTMKLLKLPITRTKTGEPVPISVPIVVGFEQERARIMMAWRAKDADSIGGALM
jgi:hypothetical protein